MGGNQNVNTPEPNDSKVDEINALASSDTKTESSPETPVAEALVVETTEPEAAPAQEVSAE